MGTTTTQQQQQQQQHNNTTTQQQQKQQQQQQQNCPKQPEDVMYAAVTSGCFLFIFSLHFHSLHGRPMTSSDKQAMTSDDRMTSVVDQIFHQSADVSKSADDAELE